MKVEEIIEKDKELQHTVDGVSIFRHISRYATLPSFEKRIAGYLVCEKCGREIPLIVPDNWFNYASASKCRGLYYYRFMEVYAGIPLYHNEEGIVCHGKMHIQKIKEMEHGSELE
jgi:hypothetical protein